MNREEHAESYVSDPCFKVFLSPLIPLAAETKCDG